VVEGRAVKIEGLADHPLNCGGLGPKGQSGLQLLYHPDRLRSPLRRDGPRGSGRWRPATWEEAFGGLSKTLGALRASGGPRALAVLDGDPRGPVRELWERFLEAYGSPNHVDHRPMSDGGKTLAMAYMHGVPELSAYDWERTQYVLGFGASLFESWCQTIHFTRASSALRRGTPGHRVKFVQVSPRFSVTAAKADEWVPIEPATYGALALALGHVLVRDKLCDSAFLQEHTFGFEDWTDAAGKPHRGFRDLLLKDYPPEKAAAVTGIPAATIVRLAHELAAHRPAIALADGAAAGATNGLGTAMAIHALNEIGRAHV
jgi:anaerobic selenocysteine-containing dehydrogenase